MSQNYYRMLFKLVYFFLKITIYAELQQCKFLYLHAKYIILISPVLCFLVLSRYPYHGYKIDKEMFVNMRLHL